MGTHTESHVITFQRDMDRALQNKSYRNAITELIDGVNTLTRQQQGWSFDEDVAGYTEHTDEVDEGRRYRWNLHVKFASATRKPNETEFASIVFQLYGRAIKPRYQWTVTEIDGKTYAPPSDKYTVSLKMEADQIGYADCEIPEDWDAHFEHLYGLDSQIARVKSALTAAIASGWVNRFNGVLFGEPGCGKSDVLLSMKRALGEHAVMSFDATATTAAGLIKTLNDAEIMPRVIIFEEIEKASPDTLVPLLGIADQRGEIVKTTARGSVDKQVKALCFATVNDKALFDKLQAGALSSRFSNPVKFERPGREVTMKVLRREIDKVDGNQEWADPAYEYCASHGIDDVRQMISICLCGADGLLDGSFQKIMDETS